MKRIDVAVVLAVVLGLAACLHDPDPGYLTSWASADSVEVLSAKALTVRFRVIGSKPTPCHEVIEPVITEDPNNRRVTVQMKSLVRKDVICITVIAPHQTAITVPVSTSGVWEFAFHDGLGGEALVVDVTIPN